MPFVLQHQQEWRDNKKYDFPTLPPYNESQKEDKMIHLMNQAIGQAFVSHGAVMANSVHNVVVKMLREGGVAKLHGTGLSAG